MRDQLFADICDRLNAKVPALKWIDMDWQQLELPELNYPVQFPCALISFPEIPWDSLTRGAQDGKVTVMVRVAIDMANDTHIAGGVTAPDRAAAMAAMQLVNNIQSALHGFEGDYFNKLMRVRSKEEIRKDGLKVYDEYFVTRANDNSGAINYQQVNAAPLVTGTFNAGG